MTQYDRFIIIEKSTFDFGNICRSNIYFESQCSFTRNEMCLGVARRITLDDGTLETMSAISKKNCESSNSTENSEDDRGCYAIFFHILPSKEIYYLSFNSRQNR